MQVNWRLSGLCGEGDHGGELSEFAQVTASAGTAHFANGGIDAEHDLGASRFILGGANPAFTTQALHVRNKAAQNLLAGFANIPGATASPSESCSQWKPSDPMERNGKEPAAKLSRRASPRIDRTPNLFGFRVHRLCQPCPQQATILLEQPTFHKTLSARLRRKRASARASLKTPRCWETMSPIPQQPSVRCPASRTTIFKSIRLCFQQLVGSNLARNMLPSPAS